MGESFVGGWSQGVRDRKGKAPKEAEPNKDVLLSWPQLWVMVIDHMGHLRSRRKCIPGLATSHLISIQKTLMTSEIPRVLALGARKWGLCIMSQVVRTSMYLSEGCSSTHYATIKSFPHHANSTEVLGCLHTGAKGFLLGLNRGSLGWEVRNPRHGPKVNGVLAAPVQAWQWPHLAGCYSRNFQKRGQKDLKWCIWGVHADSDNANRWHSAFTVLSPVLNTADEFSYLNFTRNPWRRCCYSIWLMRNLKFKRCGLLGVRPPL